MTLQVGVSDLVKGLKSFKCLDLYFMRRMKKWLLLLFYNLQLSYYCLVGFEFMISRKREKIETILVTHWVSKGDFYFYNFAVASRFIVHIFPAAAALLRREASYFQVLWKTWTQDNNFLFLNSTV